MTMKRFALAAAMATALALPAAAADLGTSGVADLEERVAELEATVARKGNRKVTLEVYGQVNKAIVWIDSPVGTESRVIDNTNSQSRFGFKGSAKINADLSAGFLIEVGLAGSNELPNIGTRNVLGVRHSAIWVGSKTLGTVWLGQTSSATDGIAEIDVSNASISSTLLSLEPLSGVALTGDNLPFDGGRGEVVKYVSPLFLGFTVSASIAGNGTDAWDVALRYANEVGGFRLAAGVGYADGGTADDERISGSASAMHLASGLFLTAAAGRVENGTLGAKIEGLHLLGGLERKFMAVGATTLYGEWMRVRLDGAEADGFGAGIVQRVDAAALDLYLGVRQYDDFDLTVVTGGARIKF